MTIAQRPPAPRIWFLRHGETVWNAEGRVQGHMESDLTALGRAQAENQREILARVLPDRAPPCLVSPLRRAQQTAQIALGPLAYETDARLKEVAAGEFEGKRRVDIARDYPEIAARAPTHLDLFCLAPGGEGFEMFQNRVAALLSSLQQDTVLIAHGLWGQVLRGLVCGLSYREMSQLSNDQGCVYLLEEGQETALR